MLTSRARSYGIVSFAQWRYRNQWGSTEVRLLLVENFYQYPAMTMWNTIGYGNFWKFLRKLIIWLQTEIVETGSNFFSSFSWSVRKNLEKVSLKREGEIYIGVGVCSSLNWLRTRLDAINLEWDEHIFHFTFQFDEKEKTTFYCNIPICTPMFYDYQWTPRYCMCASGIASSVLYFCSNGYVVGKFENRWTRDVCFRTV